MIEEAKKGLEEAGCVVDVFQAPELLSEDVLAKMGAPPKNDDALLDHTATAKLPEYDGFVFGIPTRFGMMGFQMKAVFDGMGGVSHDHDSYHIYHIHHELSNFMPMPIPIILILLQLNRYYYTIIYFYIIYPALDDRRYDRQARHRHFFHWYPERWPGNHCPYHCDPAHPPRHDFRAYWLLFP